jgi:prevent-host-death family protein
MITIGIFEAKASLGQLAQSAAEGEVIVLTRRGKPLAEIRSREGNAAQANTQQAIDDLRKFRRGNCVGPFDIADFLAEGRR